jgi:hypothetical protein
MTEILVGKMNSKEDIIGKLEALTKEEISEDIFLKADEMKNEYVTACELKNHELLDKFIEDGGNVNDFTPPKDVLDSRFNELIHILSDRENKFKKQLREEVSAKLSLKRQIVDELEKLGAEESNIGRAFQKFKELQSKWTEVGNVPSKEYKTLQNAFHRHVHNFYYNMKLSKDLRELDFKRNLEFRNALLNKIESLLEIESVRGVEKMLHLYRLEWSDMGPTSLETIEPIRTRYRELTGRVLQRIREFYKERQKKEQQHHEEKKVLLEKLQKISEENFDIPRQWIKMTEIVEQIATDWKKIGHAPKDVNDKIWRDLRTALHVFYKRKREFFATLKSSNKEIKEKKKQLIEQAEAIASAQHESWDAPTENIIGLQKQWKEAGYSERGDEEKLWKRFREVCDKFFEAKRGAFKDRDAEELKNLELKEELIKRLKDFQPTGNAESDIEALKAFSTEWKNIQHVPYKDKERVYEKYKKTLDEKYGMLKIGNSERHLLKFKSNVDMLAHNGKADGFLRKEEMQIKDRIKKLNATIAQYENNLGFFSNAKSMGSLLKDAQENLSKAKEEVLLWEKKLKMLNEAKQQT